ncbi:MAG: hypothetical protein JOY54_08815 [Acidobacteriaceae bacterium]|nr:hypothetical protein [Acidobacteriaceae bacterium]
MPASTSARPAITEFRGNLPQLAAVIQSAWAANKEVPLLYTEPFLRSAFEYPGTDLRLAPSIYSGDDLLAFVAGFPRRFQWNGRQLNLALNTFLTAAAGTRGSGYGLALWGAFQERARAAGFEGSLNFCVEGDDMNRMAPAAARIFRLNTQSIFSIEYLVRFLRPAEDLEPAPETDIDLFLELTSALPKRVPFARIWTQEEAIWQCRDRSGTIALSACHAGRRGMLTGYIMQVATTPPANTLLIEDILWGDLEDTERKELLHRFLRIAASRGAQSASCPVLNYAPLEPFTASGFRRSKRVLHTYLTTWNGAEPEALSSVYLDVF